jgi:hypothetical protein
MSRIDFFRSTHKLTEKEESFLNEVDPAGKTWLWLIRGIRQPGFCKDVVTVADAIDRFNRLRVSPKFKAAGYSADLTNYTWAKLQEVIANSQDLKSNKQKVKEYVGAQHLMSFGDFEIYKTQGVENAPVLSQLGSGSSWCTNANPETAANYLSSGPIYNVMYRDRPYAQFSPSRFQFNDPRNGNFLATHGKRMTLRNPKLHYLLSELAQTDKDVKNMIASLLVVKQHDYDYIYTIEEPRHVGLDSAKKFLKRCLKNDIAAVDWFLRNCTETVLTWASTEEFVGVQEFVNTVARAILDERKQGVVA